MTSSGGPAAPRKPWEGAQSAVSGPSPFRPASEINSTAAVVELAGVPGSADKNGLTNSAVPMQNGSIVSRPPMPGHSYGGAGYPPSNYNQYNNNAYAMNPTSYGGTYNSYNRGYGLGGGTYGGGYGLGNSYGGSYGGGMYGSTYGGGMYGGAYGTGTGMGMGMGMGTGMGMGMGMGMGVPGSFQNGSGDANNPFEDNHPAGPPSLWQSTLQKMHLMAVVFGNVASLVSENTQTFHVITTALLQFFERSGMLAGFVLKLLRMWSRPKLQSRELKNAANLPREGPKGAWDNVWSGELAG